MADTRQVWGMKRKTVAGGHAGAVAGLPGSPAIRPLAAAGPTWSSGFRMAAGCLMVLLVVGGMHAAGREISALSGAAAEGGVFFPAAGVTSPRWCSCRAGCGRWS